MKKIVALIAVAAVVVAAALWFRENRLEVYLRFSGRVTDGVDRVEGAHTFRGREGHLLVTMPENSSAPFIYLPEYHQVLLCNSKTFVSTWRIGLQKRDRDGRYPCAGSGKQEIAQDIERTDHSIAFNSWRNSTKSRIRVAW